MSVRGKLVFVTGGARSGKSTLAEKIAADLGDRVIYIATCVPADDEMRCRVERHQIRRPPEWGTVEEAHDPARIIKDLDKPGQVFLVDCLSLLLSNWMADMDGSEDEQKFDEKFRNLAHIGQEAASHVVIVSNEVGWGIVPGDPLTRLYRDILGRANQILAAFADEAFLAVAGIPLQLK